MNFYVTGTTNPGGITVKNVRWVSATDLETTLTNLTGVYNASQDKVRVRLVNQVGYEQAIDKFRSAANNARLIQSGDEERKRRVLIFISIREYIPKNPYERLNVEYKVPPNGGQCLLL